MSGFLALTLILAAALPARAAEVPLTLEAGSALELMRNGKPIAKPGEPVYETLRERDVLSAAYSSGTISLGRVRLDIDSGDAVVYFSSGGAGFLGVLAGVVFVSVPGAQPVGIEPGWAVPLLGPEAGSLAGAVRVPDEIMPAAVPGGGLRAFGGQSPPAAAKPRSWWSGLEIEPVMGAQFLGGQYFFAGARTSLNANVSGHLAPGVRLNERWSVYPSLRSAYKGTKEVVDIVGAGTVFQEQMDHRVGVKAVYRPSGSRWLIKPAWSYAFQFLKETKDEEFGSGLFDYRRLDFGLEGEFIYKDPFSVRVAATQFTTSFPNYSSLESQAAMDFNGQPLARELVGDKVLDNSGQLLSLAGNAPLKGLLLEGSLTVMRQRYAEQHIVSADGLLSPELRTDWTQSLELGATFPKQLLPDLKLAASLRLGLTRASSNQNNYDAFRTKFVAGHYDYLEFSAGPGAALTLGDRDWPTRLSLDFLYSRRAYSSRPIQAEDGVYLGDALRTDSFVLGLSASRPVAHRFKAVASLQYGVTSSNQRFEQLYKYGYTATNYLIGVSYEY